MTISMHIRICFVLFFLIIFCCVDYISYIMLCPVIFTKMQCNNNKLAFEVSPFFISITYVWRIYETYNTNLPIWFPETKLGSEAPRPRRAIESAAEKQRSLGLFWCPLIPALFGETPLFPLRSGQFPHIPYHSHTSLINAITQPKLAR